MALPTSHSIITLDSLALVVHMVFKFLKLLKFLVPQVLKPPTFRLPPVPSSSLYHLPILARSRFIILMYSFPMAVGSENSLDR